MGKGQKFNLQEAKEIFEGKFYDDEGPPVPSTDAINIRKDKEN